jgi:hypothetical protein
MPISTDVNATAATADLGNTLSSDAIRSIFQQYDMMSLWNQVQQIITEFGDNADPDQIMLSLRETPEYQQRFSANAERVKNNLPELTPAAYIQLEQQYKQVMESSGLPDNFYRSRNDYTAWIANDTSPYEVQARISTAAQAVQNSDSYVKQALKDYYGVDDAGIMAYFLDQKKGADLLTAQYGSALAGGAYKAQGMSLSKDLAQQIGNTGVTAGQAAQGAIQVAQDVQQAATLGAIYGESLSAEDLTRDTFNLAGGAEAAKKKGRLASQERAAFGGSSATQTSSLASKSASGMI